MLKLNAANLAALEVRQFRDDEVPAVFSVPAQQLAQASASNADLGWLRLAIASDG